MKPNQDRLWSLALEHLEQEWTAKLEALLRQNQLAPYLDQMVRQTWDARQKFLEGNPRLNPTELDELTLPLFVAPPNPEQDPDNPQVLSRSGRTLLNQFQSQHSPPSPQPATPTPKTMSSPPVTPSRPKARSGSSGRTSRR